MNVLISYKGNIGEKTKKDHKLRPLKHLYDQLETKDKASISGIDYVNALLPRMQIYIRITMEEYDSLEDACNKQPIVTSINNSNNSWNRNGINFRNLRYTSINMPSNNLHKVNYNIPNNYNKVNKMRHLQIKTCFFYDKPDHFTKGYEKYVLLKEEININKSIKVDGMNNKTNNSITSSLIKESNVYDNKSSKINSIQITSNDNKNE
ncbi:hypothetical protein H8356DRAFT_1353288 [Neocallimastix lanati (nom. inval.)]|nr:hypothetical protein H8356DRAFT_1353288 [Neocallimastix sp. JGI-2020a]